MKKKMTLALMAALVLVTLTLCAQPKDDGRKAQIENINARTAQVMKEVNATSAMRQA